MDEYSNKMNALSTYTNCLNFYNEVIRYTNVTVAYVSRNHNAPYQDLIMAILNKGV